MIHHDPDRTVLYIAEVRFCVREGAPERVERFSGWTAAEAVRQAWRRVRTALRSGEALAYTTRHSERLMEAGEAPLVR